MLVWPLFCCCFCASSCCFRQRCVGGAGGTLWQHADWFTIRQRLFQLPCPYQPLIPRSPLCLLNPICIKREIPRWPTSFFNRIRINDWFHVGQRPFSTVSASTTDSTLTTIHSQPYCIKGSSRRETRRFPVLSYTVYQRPSGTTQHSCGQCQHCHFNSHPFLMMGQLVRSWIVTYHQHAQGHLRTKRTYKAFLVILYVPSNNNDNDSGVLECVFLK